MNLGALRVMGLRAWQMVQGLMILLLYAGVRLPWWVIVVGAVGWLVLDWLVIYKQEQEFSLRKNELLLRKLEELR